MPDRRHVEGAAKLQLPRLCGEIGPHQNEIGNDLVAFALEVVLSHPQGVVAELIHRVGDVLGHGHALDQALVRVAAIVRGGAVAADVFERDVADVQD